MVGWSAEQFAMPSYHSQWTPRADPLVAPLANRRVLLCGRSQST